MIVPDSVWNEIKDFVPSKKSKVGRPETSPRKIFGVVFWIVKTGAQWSNIPKEWAPASTVHGKFRKWCKSGVFENIMKRAEVAYLQSVGEGSWFALDASSAKAPLGGEMTGKNPTDRGKLGAKKSIIVDFHGAPRALVVGAANTHDSKMVKDLLKSFDGRYDANQLKIMAGDKGYDAQRVKRDLIERNFVPQIALNQRGSKVEPPKIHSGYRWLVERTHAWLNNFRGVKTRWARKNSSYQAFCSIAASTLLFRMAGIFV